MDTEGLKKAILNCKPVVLKAKVHIVRKLIKKMNILRRCKDAALKEKKLKKAERVLEEVIIINRLKAFDVVNFALRNESYEDALKTPSNEVLHACAVLAKFKDVNSKVIELRKKFKNKGKLVPLLDLLEKERESKAGIKKVKKTLEKKSEKPVKKTKISKVEKENVFKINKVNNKVKKKKVDNNLEKENVVKVNNVSSKVKKRKLDSNLDKNENNVDVARVNSEQLKDDPGPKLEVVKIQSNENASDQISINNSNEEKIDDPFFVGKKIIKPKFIDNERNDDFENDDGQELENSNLKQRSRDSLWKMKETDKSTNRSDKSASKIFSNKKPEKRKSVPTRNSLPKEDDDLHPSWAAKKSIQPIIQPFQGKKIKFDD